MPLRRFALSLLVTFVATLPDAACGQNPPAVRAPVDTAPPAVAREFRAVWVATVGNMDWPSRPGLPTAQQQAELIAILDKLVALHMNAIVLQVRPAADALYRSSIEPWSDVLTGEMGRAPEPFYDPLAFAIEEAHKRGLELHAWINPYRAKYSSTRAIAPSHVSRTRPELVRRYGPYLWMDPGDPAVRARTIRVVLDMVRRYDIDGVHMDDYFYPYPETHRGREIPFPDQATWRRYQQSGGTLSRGDWRRRNVDLLVEQLNDSVHAAKPWVRFGVSPFGIWRPGSPPSVRGLDQYEVLYADARKWLREGWMDYITPQLYWAVDRPEQSYPVLLRWWAEQNVKGRNLWPGNYTGKVAFTNGSAWPTSEIIQQIRLTRAQPGATGNVHFSMTVFQQDPDSLDERLLREVYAAPALVPATPWLGRGTPERPTIRVRSDSVSGETVLEMQPSSDSGEVRASSLTAAAAPQPWLWVVQVRTETGWTTTILRGTERRLVVGTRGATLPNDVRVMAIDRLGVASPVARAAAAAPSVSGSAQRLEE